MSRIKKFLLIALAAVTVICLSLGAAACGEDEKEEKTVNYSVTVVCDDPAVLVGVKVQLTKNGTPTEAKPLVNGKAVFALEAGEYTVSLFGVPDDYTYESKTLTAAAPEATVTLTKKPEETVGYTVTVVCDDPAVLVGVKVRIMKGSETAGEQALKEGKANFTLAAGNYTATLTGVSADYTFEPGRLTAAAPDVTITLAKKTIDVDLTVKIAAGKDVFGGDHAETALKGATVALYASKQDIKPVATAKTDEGGKAHFDAIAKAVYLVSVNGEENGNLMISEETAELTLNVKFGSKTAPLTWTVGENHLAFTQQILESLGDAAVYYTLSVPKDGLYSFDADNRNVNIQSDLFELVSDRHATAELTAGVLYTFACSSVGADGFAYTVTVSEGDTGQDVPPAPSVPWEGAGTKSDPYRVVTIADVYELQCSSQSEIFFTYTASESKNYLLSLEAGSSPLVFQIGDARHELSGEQTAEFSLAAGTVLFSVTPAADGQTALLRFRIAEKAATDPDPDKPDPDNPDPPGPVDPDKPDPDKPDPDDPKPDGTQEHPYPITVLIGSYENIRVEYTGTQFKDVYYTYLPKADGNYTMTLTRPGIAVISLTGARPVAGQNVVPYLNADRLSADFRLTAGKELIICVSGDDDDSSGKAPATFTCSFTIAAYVEPEAEQGSAHNPAPLGELLGTHVIEKGGGRYYLYHSSEAGKYFVSTTHQYGITFTVRTELTFDDFGAPAGTPYYRATLGAGDKGVFELEADKDYYISVSSNYDNGDSGFSPEGGAAGSVDFTIENWTAGEPDGTQANPYPLETPFGEHAFKKVDETGVYYTFTLAEETTVTVTAHTKYFCLQFNSLTRWQVTSSGAPKTFTLPAGTVVLHVWNMQSGEADVSFKIEKTSASATSATGAGTASAVTAAACPENSAWADPKRTF